MWKALRKCFIWSPQRQKQKALAAFKGQEVNWHDVFVVPDFVKFFQPYINNIDRYARRFDDVDWTQLQFIVEAYESGVRTRYRAYAQDEVIELWRVDAFKAEDGKSLPKQVTESKSGYVPVNVKVKTYPELDERQFTVLKRNSDGSWAMPSGMIPPAEFKQDGVTMKNGKEILTGPFQQIIKVMNFVRASKWSEKCPRFNVDWEEFYAEYYPKEQTAAEFVRKYPHRYHVPFASYFASSDVVQYSEGNDCHPSYSDRTAFLQATSNPSVRLNKSTNIPPRSILGHEELGLASAVPIPSRSLAENQQISNNQQGAPRNVQRRPKSTKVPQTIDQMVRDQLLLALQLRNVTIANKNAKKPELVTCVLSIPGMNELCNQQALINSVINVQRERLQQRDINSTNEIISAQTQRPSQQTTATAHPPTALTQAPDQLETFLANKFQEMWKEMRVKAASLISPQNESTNKRKQ